MKMSLMDGKSIYEEAIKSLTKSEAIDMIKIRSLSQEQRKVILEAINLGYAVQDDIDLHPKKSGFKVLRNLLTIENISSKPKESSGLMKLLKGVGNLFHLRISSKEVAMKLSKAKTANPPLYQYDVEMKKEEFESTYELISEYSSLQIKGMNSEQRKFALEIVKIKQKLNNDPNSVHFHDNTSSRYKKMESEISHAKPYKSLKGFAYFVSPVTSLVKAVGNVFHLRISSREINNRLRTSQNSSN